MKIIVISPPDTVEDELATVGELFEQGLDIFHLRKPDYSQAEMASLLDGIDSRHYRRIMLHSHHGLVAKYGLRGAHYPAALRSGTKIEDDFSRSTSCHSVEELEELEAPYDYCFLSPAFDSVSKPGYRAAFDMHELSACASGSGQRVVALGGVTSATIGLLPKNCWGAAVLGAVWGQGDVAKRIEGFLTLQRVAAEL